MIKIDKQAITKVCPDCGNDLTVRENRHTGSQFIGCQAWPSCTHTEPIPETLRMRLLGAPSLFDDDSEDQ